MLKSRIFSASMLLTFTVWISLNWAQVFWGSFFTNNISAVNTGIPDTEYSGACFFSEYYFYVPAPDNILLKEGLEINEEDEPEFSEFSTSLDISLFAALALLTDSQILSVGAFLSGKNHPHPPPDYILFHCWKIFCNS